MASIQSFRSGRTGNGKSGMPNAEQEKRISRRDAEACLLSCSDRQDAKGSNNTMSDKRYHELHEWNESLEWKHGESLSIVPSNYRAVLVAFGVLVPFVTKAVLGELAPACECSHAGRP